MKIEDAISQNRNYWAEESLKTERRITNLVEEVRRLQVVLAEAKEQILLFDKAGEILMQLKKDNNVGVGQMDVKPAEELATVAAEAVAVEGKK